MELRALNSIKGLKPNDEYVLPGEVFDIKDPVEALRLIAEEAAEEVVKGDPGETIEEEAPKIVAEEEANHLAAEEQDKLRAAETNKEMLGRIAAAQTVAELNELLPKEGDDAEILTAFDAKLAEIKPE